MKHYGERVRQARMGSLPRGRRMLDASLEEASLRGLGDYLPIEGRTSMLKQWLHWTATAFRRWCHAGSSDWNEYRRGIAHLLLLGAPGAGDGFKVCPPQLSSLSLDSKGMIAEVPTLSQSP